MSRLLLPAVIALGLAAPVRAADPTPAELATRARSVLKQFCHRCHGVGFEVEGLDVLDLKTLTAARGTEPGFVVPGKPDESYLFEKIANNTMPPRKERERPTAEDRAAVERWIKAGAPPFPKEEARPFVSNRDVLAAVRNDLRKAPANVRPHLRYFTLAHLHNNPRFTAADLRQVRAAVSKVVNSLTWRTDIVLPRAIDKHETVLAVDVSRIDWDRDDLWRSVLRHYPYGLSYRHSRDTELRDLEAEIGELTDADLPYVRADWFVAIATRPPLYHTLLKLPHTDYELERRLGVDATGNFRDDKLARAGFATSGVSGQNRLVERHPSHFGAYWKSYDFRARKPRTTLTRFPLGPAFDANPYPRQAFVHDGGEMIFHLPNGLQGYLLIDGRGRRIDEGPTDVVSDSLKTSGSAAIVNGTSCMSCHKHGMIPFKDTVRDGTAVFGDAREKVLTLYKPRDEMDRLVRRDSDRFLRSLEDAVGPFLQVGDDKDKPIRDFPEPVGEVARSYLLIDLGPTEVACELGLEKPTDLPVMIRGNRMLRELGLAPLANGNPIKRDEWDVMDGNSLFQEVARQLELGAPVRPIN